MWECNYCIKINLKFWRKEISITFEGLFIEENKKSRMLDCNKFSPPGFSDISSVITGRL